MFASVPPLISIPPEEETNSEGKQYIRKARQKTKVESLIPLHPIAEQILALYTKEQSRAEETTRYFPIQ